MAMTPYQPPDTRMALGQTATRPEDLVFPRIKVVQQMSDEAQGEEPRAKPGDFYNVLTGENAGRKLIAYPIVNFTTRVFLTPKQDDGKRRVNDLLQDAGRDPLSPGDGLKCRSDNMYEARSGGEPGGLCNECPLSKWMGNVPPPCSELYNVAAMGEYGDLIILSFSKSSAKTGKRIFSAIRFRKAKPWTNVWEFTTRLEKNDKGSFWVPDFRIGEPADPQIINDALAWARELQGVTIDVTPAVDEEEPGIPAAPDGEAPFA